MEKTEAFLENQVNKLSSELREQAGNKMMKFFDFIKYVRIMITILIIYGEYYHNNDNGDDMSFFLQWCKWKNKIIKIFNLGKPVTCLLL